MTRLLTPADMGILGYEGSFLDFLGFGVSAHEPDYVRLQMPLERIHTNTMQMAHGGIIMSMLDIAGAFSAHAGLEQPMVSITMTQATNFLRAVTGDLLVAEGRVVRRTRGVVFTESRVLDPSLSDDPDEQLCATGQCSFKLRPRPTNPKDDEESG
ncbi:MAG: PaaI family thioesterase [Pseudomonadota bacterium]